MNCWRPRSRVVRAPRPELWGLVQEGGIALPAVRGALMAPLYECSVESCMLIRRKRTYSCLIYEGHRNPELQRRGVP